MMGIYSAMFNVAVPTIRDEFTIQPDMAAWVVAVYSLPFMMFMPLHGRLADAYGMRRVLLAGTAIFMLGTLIAGLAPSLGWLMAGRAIQGFGSAGFTPLALAIIARVFPAEERGKLMGTWKHLLPDWRIAWTSHWWGAHRLSGMAVYLLAHIGDRLGCVLGDSATGAGTAWLCRQGFPASV